ncbi:MAG: DUF1566 domain-containing protein [Chloroflexi bacterium]|nr:DUF1566 domain-containing protein [Chloroflexota bacterium]
MSDQAVLDHETGLVWLRNPVESFVPFGTASDTCNANIYAGRLGWRLPALNELYSLVDESLDDNLPDGLPFQDVSGGPYWTTTPNRGDGQLMQTIALFGGFYEELAKPRYGTDAFSVAAAWCVRGPGGGYFVDRPDEQPAWTRTLAADNAGDTCNSARFECVLGGIGALDRETGLVWDRDPSAALRDWDSAFNNCLVRTVGGRKGWRLPTAAELGSIVDPSVPAPDIMLPPGHPFTVAGVRFWSSTEGTSSSANAYYVDFSIPDTEELSKISSSARAWCVRGGSTSGN